MGAQPTDQVRNLLNITGDWQRFKGLPGAEGTLRTKAVDEGATEAAVKAADDEAERRKAQTSAQQAAADTQADEAEEA